MPKFLFVCELESDEDYPGRRNSVEFEADTWDEVVVEMNDFLHGCGYQFKGQLEMVQEETTMTEPACGGSTCAHSMFFFDAERNL